MLALIINVVNSLIGKVLDYIHTKAETHADRSADVMSLTFKAYMCDPLHSAALPPDRSH